jgi:hypothetical protein
MDDYWFNCDIVYVISFLKGQIMKKCAMIAWEKVLCIIFKDSLERVGEKIPHDVSLGYTVTKNRCWFLNFSDCPFNSYNLISYKLIFCLIKPVLI